MKASRALARCIAVQPGTIVTAALLAGCWRHGAPSTPPASDAPATCLHDERRHFRMARVGADIVLCGESEDWDVGWGAPDDALPLRAECYTLRADGTLHARAFQALPGIGFAYDGPCAGKICWSARRARIAFHPDGARAALIDQYEVKIVDVASGRATSQFTADIPGDFWFVGERVYIASAPAGPGASLRAFTLAGEETRLSDGLWHGGITLTDPGHLMYQANGLTSIDVLDGKQAPVRLRARTLAGPCEATTGGSEWTHDPDDTPACKAHLARHHVPYDRALVIGDGARLVGFLPARREVFTLDAATLAETSRVRVRTCR